MNTLTGKSGKTAWIWLIIAIFFSKELLWSYLVPPWQAPDEISHYGYVETLFYEHAFPVFGQTLLSERVQAIGPVESAREIDFYKGSLNLNWIAQHPPLYYLGLEPLFALMPHEDPVTCIFLLRLVSMLLGCITLWFAHKTLRILLPDNELAQKAVIVGMAFLPMFSAISAAVNNDNLVIMLAGILTYLSVKNFEKHDAKGSLQIGIVLGLLALTKATSLPLWISIFLLEMVKHVRRWMEQDRRKGRWKNAAGGLFLHQSIIFGTALAVAGWWYARNYTLYSSLLPEIGSLISREPTLLQLYPNLVVAFPEATGNIALPQATWWDFLVKLRFVWEYYKNMWGAFGQFFFRLFSWQYAVIGALTVFSAAGFVKFLMLSAKNGLFKKRKLGQLGRQIFRWNGWALLLPLLTVFMVLTVKLFEIYRMRGFLGAMHGRYMFSALIAFMYFFIRGIEHATVKKYLPAVLLTVMAFFVLNDFTALMYRIIPEFY